MRPFSPTNQTSFAEEPLTHQNVSEPPAFRSVHWPHSKCIASDSDPELPSGPPAMKTCPGSGPQTERTTPGRSFSSRTTAHAGVPVPVSADVSEQDSGGGEGHPARASAA